MMRPEYVPLLGVLRAVYAVPRGPGRFAEYLRAMGRGAGGEVRLPPLALANPMAREHVTEALDALLAADADGRAALAVAAAAPGFAGLARPYRIGLIVADDARGGWTNRAATDYAARFEGEALARRGWIAGLLWSSDVPSVEVACASAVAAVARRAYIDSRGPAQTLAERLAQEGYALAAAGAGSVLDPNEIDASRAIIAPMLGSTDKRAAIECLFGDEAARSLGFTPRGLPRDAGLAIALHDARAGRHG